MPAYVTTSPRWSSTAKAPPLPLALRRIFSASPACTNAIFVISLPWITIQGSANAMADDCLRLWHLNDSQLLDYFNARYPQRNTWKLCHMRPSENTSTLVFP
jgi:hypothetical protein